MLPKRLAVVTGGARGIGRAIVLALLKQGREVVALDVNEEQLKELERVCKEGGFDVGVRVCDITKTAALTSLLETLADEHGGIGILVNNAGITRDKLMIRMDEDDYDRLMAVNLKAAFMATVIAGKSMIRNNWGRIINISSVAGILGQAGSANYAASKAGLIGMTKSVARELGKKNVTANCIAPGFIQTEMTAVLPAAVREGALAVIPAKRLGNPEDVASAVAYLASDEASYITGQVLCVDGGMAM
jgi:3-oxoacyl-[acyl-carrier protein] reductase